MARGEGVGKLVVEGELEVSFRWSFIVSSGVSVLLEYRMNAEVRGHVTCGRLRGREGWVLDGRLEVVGSCMVGCLKLVGGRRGFMGGPRSGGED